MWLSYRNHCLRAAILLLVCASAAKPQERQNSLGVNINLVGGGSSIRNIGSPLVNGALPVRPFYGVYPGLTFTSIGARSSVNASYTLGVDRTDSDPPFDAESHDASLELTKTLSPRWTFSFSDSFQVTADATGFNAVRGVTPSPDDFRFIFNPSGLRMSTRNNNANIMSTHRLSERSTISIGASHGYREYDDARGTLSDQQWFAGSLTYSRRTSTRDSFSVAYTGGYFIFGPFEDAHADTGTAGYDRVIAPDLTFRMTVGATWIRNARSGYIGYNTSVGLYKTIDSNLLSLSYNQESGEPTGLGSISDTQRVAFAFRRARNRTELFMDISGFETHGTLDNPENMRGLAGAASIGFALSRNFSIHGGGEYQRILQTSRFAFTQHRLFVSLRFNNPNLWRF